MSEKILEIQQGSYLVMQFAGDDPPLALTVATKSTDTLQSPQQTNKENTA